MVKVERCTCPVKHCFLKFRITDRFFVLLKSTESLKSTKRAITRMHWLCGQVSGNIFGFFLKTINFFYEQIFSVFQTLHLVGTWKLLTTKVIRFNFYRPPRHVNGISRCVHTLARLDVYVCPIKVILSVVKGWAMLVIAQYYNCSITFFFLRIRLKIVKKWLEPYSNFSIWKKGTVPLLRTILRFIRTSKYLFKVIKY